MRRSVYDDDHVAFRDSVRQFLRREVLPHVEDHARDHEFGREMWLAAGKQGLLGLEVPEQYGGSQAEDYRFNAVLTEELAAVNLALASSLSIHFDVVTGYLTALTTPEQQERWLPGIASGESIAAIAMTEPSAGSDLAALKTSAVRDGENWRLNGAKTFITNGYSADIVVVAARTTPGAGARGISLFVVERSREGFSRGRRLDKVGMPEADTAELVFDDVLLPAENLIGELDQGFKHMMVKLPRERISGAVANLAHARAILDETLVYVKDRQAFGQPVGSFQHNKFLLADLVTRAEVTQAYVDDCVRAHTAGELSAVDAAKAKWWTADVQGQILDACLQLHGGYGYMNEYRVARAGKTLA